MLTQHSWVWRSRNAHQEAILPALLGDLTYTTLFFTKFNSLSPSPLLTAAESSDPNDRVFVCVCVYASSRFLRRSTRLRIISSTTSSCLLPRWARRFFTSPSFLSATGTLTHMLLGEWLMSGQWVSSFVYISWVGNNLNDKELEWKQSFKVCWHHNGYNAFIYLTSPVFLSDSILCSETPWGYFLMWKVQWNIDIIYSEVNTTSSEYYIQVVIGLACACWQLPLKILSHARMSHPSFTCWFWSTLQIGKHAGTSLIWVTKTFNDSAPKASIFLIINLSNPGWLGHDNWTETSNVSISNVLISGLKR